MENLIGRYRNFNVLAAVIVIQVVGLAVQVKRSSEDTSSRLIRVWAVSAVTPLEKALVWAQTGVSGVWHNYFYLRGVRQENRGLQQQIQELKLEQVRLKQDAQQARRLQALLGFKEQYIAQTVAAQVIGSSGSEQSRIVYIDKGADAGLKRDMPVITADGVVGKVLSVWDSSAQVLLLSDQTSGVGAILEQSRLQGVLRGKASGDIVLDKVMMDEEVKPGDKVLTSGGDQIFPKGLIVGTVAKVSKGAEFLQIAVKPAAALNHLEEVLVITKKEERQASSPEPNLRAADILAQRLPSVPDKPAAAATAAAQKPTVSPKLSTTGASPPNSAASEVKPGVNHAASVPGNPATLTTQQQKPVVTKTVSAPVTTQPKEADPQPPQPESTGDTPQ
jgi:rod shape-determining protein MreC